MAKRLTEKQIDEIIKLFVSGANIEKISKKFDCTKLTISRNLKKNLGESKFKELSTQNKLENKNENDSPKNLKNDDQEKFLNKKIKDEFSEMNQFIEIVPLNSDFENSKQEDLTSIPISEVDLPKTVFMIVDNKVELEIKYLKDYPNWQFLSSEELNRKTIEIYLELKIAKSFCGKDQKVIKVPNTNVFKIVAPILIDRGISRIVSTDKLIAL